VGAGAQLGGAVEGRFMAERMPRATLRVLLGYGHICLINHDLNLLDHVGPWIDSLESAEGVEAK